MKKGKGVERCSRLLRMMLIQEMTARSQCYEREWSGATVAANDVVQETTEASRSSQEEIENAEVVCARKEGNRQSRIC